MQHHCIDIRTHNELYLHSGPPKTNQSERLNIQIFYDLDFHSSLYYIHNFYIHMTANLILSNFKKSIQFFPVNKFIVIGNNITSRSENLYHSA